MERMCNRLVSLCWLLVEEEGRFGSCQVIGVNPSFHQRSFSRNLNMNRRSNMGLVVN